MHKLLLSFCALVGALTAPLAQGQNYTVTDLGTLGGTSSQALDINNAGQVVGSSLNATGQQVPFLYSGGTMQTIGLPVGMLGTATSINDSGLIVGNATPTGSGTAFFSQGGVLTFIPGFAVASAVNNVGQIVVTPTAGTSSIYLGGSASAPIGLIGTSINNSGVVAGYYNPVFRNQAATYNGGVFTNLGPQFSAPTSQATGINDFGQLSVYTQATTILEAFRYTSGTIINLGSLGSQTNGNTQALAINNFGHVVGSSTLLQFPFQSHAFIHDGLNIYDLNNYIPAGSGWELLRAASINDLGQIVGTGLIGGQQHAFLLTPIPEPGVTALLGAAVGLGFFWRRRVR